MLSDPEATLTVFAPKNSAFAALPDGAVASLLLPENQETLTSLLGKHVLGTVVPASGGAARGRFLRCVLREAAARPL